MSTGIYSQLGIRTSAAVAAQCAEHLAAKRAAAPAPKPKAGKPSLEQHPLYAGGYSDGQAGKVIAPEVLPRYHAAYQAGYKAGQLLAAHAREHEMALAALEWESEKGACPKGAYAEGWLDTADGGAVEYVVELRESPEYEGCRWVALRVTYSSSRAVRLGEYTSMSVAKVACGRDYLGL